MITYKIQRVHGPFLNKSVPNVIVPESEFSELVGVDGRFLGRIKRFPSMKNIGNLGLAANEELIEAKHLFFNKYDETGYISGFVAKVKNTATSKYKISFYYKEDSGLDSEYVEYSIVAYGGISSDTNFDVDSSGHLGYIAISNSNIKYIAYEDSSFDLGTAGAGYDSSSATGFTAPTLTAGDTGGTLDSGKTYDVAYRFYSTRDKVFSALSEVVSVTMNGEEGDDEVRKITVTDFGTRPNDRFDKIQIYRSIAKNNVSIYSGSMLYRETTVSHSTASVDIGTTNDEVLTTLERFDEENDIVSPTPKADIIRIYKGCIFCNEIESGNITNRILFTNPMQESIESFSPYAYFDLQKDDINPLSMTYAGDNMFIVTYGGLILVSKSGTSVKFTRLHNSRGSTSRNAAHTVGNDIFCVSNLGIVIVEGYQANMEIYIRLNDVIHSEWVDSLSSIHSCYDTSGASFFLNTEESEVYIIWHNIKSATKLEYVPFIGCETASNIEENEWKNIACFFTKTGKILTPSFRDTDYNVFSMAGHSESKSKRVISVTDDVVTVGLDTDIEIGEFVYFYEDDLDGIWGVITDTESYAEEEKTELTILSLDGESLSIKATQNFYISPIVFKSIFGNIDIYKNESYDYNSLFLRRAVRSVSVMAQNISHTNNFYNISMRRNGSAIIGDSKCPMKTNPAESVVSINADGINLEPIIKCYDDVSKFDIIAIELNTVQTRSRSVNSD